MTVSCYQAAQPPTILGRIVPVGRSGGSAVDTSGKYAAELRANAAYVTEGAVAGGMAQQHRHLDLRLVPIGEAGETLLAFAGAPGARSGR